MMMRILGALVLLVMPATQKAYAQASPPSGHEGGVASNVPAEGLPTATNLWTGLRYAYAFERPNASTREHEASFDLRGRLALGGTVAYLVGVDGSIGGSDGGFLYELEAHLVGLAVRWEVGMAGLSGGVGLGGVTAEVPIALQVPAELFVESNLGPVRLLVAVTVRFAFGADVRRGGSPLLDFADEMGAALFLRVGDERRLWGRTVAGWGPAIGITYRERMDSRIIGFALALSLSGGN